MFNPKALSMAFYLYSNPADEQLYQRIRSNIMSGQQPKVFETMKAIREGPK